MAEGMKITIEEPSTLVRIVLDTTTNKVSYFFNGIRYPLTIGLMSDIVEEFILKTPRRRLFDYRGLEEFTHEKMCIQIMTTWLND